MYHRTPFEVARDELAAEEWRALVAAEKKKILRRRSRWHFIRSWLMGRVRITLTWRD